MDNTLKDVAGLNFCNWWPPDRLERAIILLRNDWHSIVKGALLWVLEPTLIDSGYAPRR